MIEENGTPVAPESAGLTVRCRIAFGKGARGRKRIEPEGSVPKKEVLPEPRLPSVVRVLVRAHVYERMLTSGVYAKHSDLAYSLGMTSARLAQILSLLLLSPSLQDAVLALPPVLPGEDPITERELRRIAMEPDWSEQKRLWEQAMPSSERSEGEPPNSA